MQGLREVKEEALPFVRLFYGQPTYLWEDDDNIVHSIPQGEGGEQGDPLMPLASTGQAVAAQLQDGEKLFAFLDDIHVVCPRPDRVLPVHAIIQRELWTHARIRVHNGKTHVWNMSGVRPAGCDMLQRLAEQHVSRGQCVDRFRGAGSRARDHHLGHSVGSRRVRAGTVGVEIQGT